MASSNATPEMVPAFNPTVWGDFFINYTPEPMQESEEWMSERVDELKEEVSKLFESCDSRVAETLNLVDTLEHLGIDHHFEGHIATALSNAHDGADQLDSSSSLHDVALRFRLLRQHGFWVSPDEFNVFKDADGSFNAEITNDPRGLLSLYNAAHLFTHGEVELEDAILFSRRHLEAMGSKLESPLAEQVTRFLQIPLPRTLKRIEALRYIAEYKPEQAYYSPSMLELAKLDFNLLQRLHQRELKAFCRWGNGLYREVGLSYSRDRIVECYFWSYTVYYEQNYAQARIILAKLLVLTSMLDDTFDVHATLEEGRKLNEAIQRWDASDISLLPEYLKKYYAKLMNTFREIEDELKPDDKYRVAYCVKAFQTQCRHYQQEAEWFHHSYVPSFQDHVNLSVISSGAPMLCVGLLVGMGDEATKEAFEWAIGCTDAVKACGEVTRFMDDLAAFKHGKNKMDVASSIDCYIKEHNATSEVAIAVLDNLVEDAWKTTNQARFDRRALLPFINRAANLTKSMTFLFHDKRDAYTFSADNKETIEQQFIDHIPI